MPIDPLAIQKVEIFRGPEALRYGSQAVGGVVEATNNRIPFAAPPGGWQTQFLGADNHGRPRRRRRRPVRRRLARLRFPRRLLRAARQRLFRPELPYLFPPDPAPAFNGKQPNSSFAFEGEAVGGSYLFDGGYVGAAIARFSRSIRFRRSTARPTNTRIDAGADQDTAAKASFGRRASAIDVVRFWAGAVEYHHDEIGIGDSGIDGVQATFNNHAQEFRDEIQFMPMATPFGALISTSGAQFDHQQLDTSGDAGEPARLGAHQPGRRLFYQRAVVHRYAARAVAGRIENVRLDGTAGMFPTTLLPPPDNPDAARCNRSATCPRASASA